jgi:SAM-dependent methyltransferase
MTEGAIIQLPQWLKSPAGQYLLEWEQRHLDHAVADLFGFHALQLGLPQLDALRANRMPHRWLAVESAGDDEVPAIDADMAPGAAIGAPPAVDANARVGVVPAPSLRCHFDALPFDSSSLDLVILPHALELARDPHLALREVERVLVPEGRVIIVGFNPASLWGTRQRLGRLRRRLSRSPGELFLPHAGEFVGYRRLRDWLRLLSFEVEAGRFGCYIPPLRSARWLARFGWMERAGEHWWPVFGALYYIVAVKRVRGMRLVGLIRKDARLKAAVTAPAPVSATPHAGRVTAENDEIAGIIGR